MNKSVYYILTIACCLSFVPEADFISSIKQKADNYFTKTNRAKLELIFNQPRYAPGDTAWFKTNYVRAMDLKPIAGNQIVHVCLYDHSGKKRLTRWFSVNNGSASNEFPIPENLTSGNYILVAFTDWMKNLDNALFFRQEFVLAGKNTISKMPLRDTIEFYPEGGRLIAGIENKVAIRFQGSQDRVSALFKESGKEIALLNLVKDSVAILQLNPSASSEYYVEFLGKKIALPQVSPSGISLRSVVANHRVTLQIQKSNTDNRELYLLAFNGGGLVFQNRIDFGDDQKSEIILPPSLPNGIVQMVIADSKYNLEATRAIYVDTKPVYTLNALNSTPSYSTRQLVDINVQVKSPDGLGATGVMSYRVINNDLFQSREQKMDYLTFRSDISNTFELKKEFATPTTINDYLITQTCPWFDWKKMLDKDMIPQFKPQEYLTLSGRAVYAKNGSPVRDSTLIMFYLEKNLSGYETYANSKGHFSFPLVLNVNTSDRFFYTASYKGNDVDEITVKIDDPDSLVSVSKQPADQVVDLQDAYYVYRTQRNTINNSYAFFLNPKALSDSTFDSNRAMEEELNGADATVRLSDYLQMPSMEEVLKEIVRAVDYRKINGRHVVRVYTTVRRPNNHTGPLYVIDGQLTKNPEQFLTLKPADVVSIKLVKDNRKLFALGQLGANGVILVKTKKHIKVQEKNMIEYSGLLPESRDWSVRKMKDQLPELRACLHWAPVLRTDLNGSSEIKFTTSDDVGNFKIQIYGVTENGIPFSHEIPFEVKYQGN